MTVDLTDALQSFVDSESNQRGFSSGNDFVLDLLEKAKGLTHLRTLIEAGESSPAQLIDIDSYFTSLRNKIKGNTKL